MPSARSIEYIVMPTGFDKVDSDEKWHWTWRVVWREPQRWAVVRDGMCLVIDTHEWQYESMPSERTDEFKAATRQSLTSALSQAYALIDNFTVMGKTFIQAFPEANGDGS